MAAAPAIRVLADDLAQGGAMEPKVRKLILRRIDGLDALDADGHPAA